MNKKEQSNQDLERMVEFMGVFVVPATVQNPHLKRVIQRTSSGGFRFKYDDWSKTRWTEYNDWRETKIKYHETARYDDHEEYWAA